MGADARSAETHKRISFLGTSATHSHPPGDMVPWERLCWEVGADLHVHSAPRAPISIPRARPPLEMLLQ